MRETSGVPQKNASLKDTLSAAVNSKMKLGIIVDSDPAHSLPAGYNCSQALLQTDFVAAFGCFLNDTTMYADIVLPDHHFLESWSAQVDITPHGTPFLSAQQPVVQPLYETMQSGDALLKAATMAGMDLGVASQEALVLKMVEDLRRGWDSVPSKLDGKKAWEHILQRGGWWPEEGRHVGSDRVAEKAWKDKVVVETPVFSTAANHDFHLYPYRTVNIGDGKTANIAWLMEMPEPMTTIKWGSWVEINPKTAAKLGIADGDIVRLETQFGFIEAPASIYPGISPDTLAAPMGYGHISFGKLASGRGANVMKLVGGGEAKGLDGLAWRGVMAKITKTGDKVEIIREGNPKGDYEGEVFQL
jgi:molybdopterin-containing oxidoreductase family iron-sulfur binding subunit